VVLPFRPAVRDHHAFFFKGLLEAVERKRPTESSSSKDRSTSKDCCECAINAVGEYSMFKPSDRLHFLDCLRPGGRFPELAVKLGVQRSRRAQEQPQVFDKSGIGESPPQSPSRPRRWGR
jgi:hypothetical protein